MIYILGIIVLTFILAGIVTLMGRMKEGMPHDQIEFYFTDDIFKIELKDLKYEEPNGLTRIDLQNRGSVRIAQGRVMSKKDFDERKSRICREELP